MSDDKTIIVDQAPYPIGGGGKRKNACLVQYSGAKLGRRYPLTEAQTVVGRSPNVEIAIDDNSVSRQHARFTQQGEQVAVEDLVSRNGTYLNDTRIAKSTLLKDGDIIRLGTVLLKFFAHDNVDNIIHDKIYKLATIDDGTQIFNKQYLLDALEGEFKFSRSYGRELALIYYDLDHFKAVNDTYGHNAGDVVLRESAQLVKTAVRKDDTLGRFGGEEFVIILPNTESQTAAELAERIRQRHEGFVFNLEVDKDGAKRRVAHRQTISMGIASLKPEMQTIKDLLGAADAKLYRSKQTGRNRVTV